MDIDRLCMGCMGDREEKETCPRCGWVEGTPQESLVQLPPRTIMENQYLIGKVLGQGGFGITYLGWDMKLERKIAVKEYFPNAFACRAYDRSTVSVHSAKVKSDFNYGLGKFIEEGRTLAKFQEHPGIVSVLNLFEANDTAYLVMEYVEGITLKEYLENEGGQIPFEMAFRIMVPVMDALREVHHENLLHRDISPDNIYITKKRQVKLLDFGAARYHMDEHSSSLSVILKHGYAPREQYQRKGHQGAWSDVYALAATFYHAITGEIPPAALDRIEIDELQDPAAQCPGIPPQSRTALLKALAVNPQDRYQTMKEFQDAISLREIPSAREEKKTRLPPPPPATVMKPPPAVSTGEEEAKKTGEKKPNPMVVYGAIAVALAIILVFILTVFSPSPESPGQSRDLPSLSRDTDNNGVAKPGDGCYVNSDGVWEKTVTVGRSSIEMIYVPPGNFMMGSPHTETNRGPDENIHKVTISHGFWLGKHEVTQYQWEPVMDFNPSRFPKGLQYPVEQVSWDDVQLFIKKINRKTGLEFRLPTEAEWEYACRAGTRTVFAFGDRITSGQVNYNALRPYNGGPPGIYRKSTIRVKSFKPNKWGLYDMHGNVWEWCADWYGREYYLHSPSSDPTGPPYGTKRVIRGGSWINRGSYNRSATRNCYPSGVRFETGTSGGYFGFRLCMGHRRGR